MHASGLSYSTAVSHFILKSAKYVKLLQDCWFSSTFSTAKVWIYSVDWFKKDSNIRTSSDKTGSFFTYEGMLSAESDVCVCNGVGEYLWDLLKNFGTEQDTTEQEMGRTEPWFLPGPRIQAFYCFSVPKCSFSRTNYSSPLWRWF